MESRVASALNISYITMGLLHGMAEEDLHEFL